MTVSIIAVVSDNSVIGRNNRLPWRQSTDLKRFKKLTTGHHLLMGRKTYEVSLKMGGGGAYSGMKTYVFSRTWKDRRDPNVEIVSDDAATFVRNLKNRDGKAICCMGGGEFAQSLFEAGVIDEVGLNIHPILLGSGIPLFLEMRQVDLELVECKTIKGGCAYVLYRVKK